MVKTFALLGFTAVLFLTQGCGGKKEVASAPSQPVASSRSGPSGDGGSSGASGPGEASSMALPTGPNGGSQPGLDSGSGSSSFDNPGYPPSGNDGGGLGQTPGMSPPGGTGLSPMGGNNFASNNQRPAGFGNQPRAIPKVVPPPTLKDQAVNAFQSGNPKRAYAYLQGHALQVSDEEAAETLKHYRWASHKKRPQLGLNIAVGVSLKNPQNATDLSPLGTQQKNNGAGGDMAMASMGGMGGPAANAGKSKTLDETTGIFGSQLVAAFKEKHESGAWSPAFSEYSLATSRGNGFGSMAGAFGSNNAGGFDGGMGNPGGFSNQFGPTDNGGVPSSPSGFAGQPSGYPTGEGAQPTDGGLSGPPSVFGGNSGGPGGNSGGPVFNSGGPGGNSGGPGGNSGGPVFNSGGPGGNSGGPGGNSGGPVFNSGGPGGNSGGPPGAQMNSGGPSSPLRFQGKGVLGSPNLGGPGAEPGPGLAGPGLAGPGMAGPGMPGPGMAGPGMPGPGMPGPGMMAGPGMPGPGMAGPGTPGPGMGGPGMGGPGMDGPGMFGPGMFGPGTAGTRGNAPVFNTDPKLPPGSSPLAPCLTFIGVDEASKLMKKAWQEGYDGLMLFEVTIGVNRAYKWVLNDTLVRVVQPNVVPKDVKRIYVSKSFNNIQFAKTKAKGEPDGLEEAIEKIIKATEEGLALQSFPSALTPEIIATKRIPTLVKETEVSVLDRLSEVNLYYYKGFIDEKRKADAFEQIAGEPGRVIATGSSVERLAAIEKLLDREFK